MCEKEIKKAELDNETLDEVNGGNILGDVMNLLDNPVVDFAKDLAVQAIASTPGGKAVLGIADIIDKVND